MTFSNISKLCGGEAILPLDWKIKSFLNFKDFVWLIKNHQSDINHGNNYDVNWVVELRILLVVVAINTTSCVSNSQKKSL